VLVVDTRASAKLKIQHKKQQFICHYPAFQQYVAAMLAPRLRTSDALNMTQVKNSGFKRLHNVSKHK